MKHLYFIIAFICISQPILAKSYNWKKECDKNQATMTKCSGEMFTYYDNELNVTYKKVMSSLSSDKRIQLRKEQRAWLKNRDPECKLTANESAKGGSMWPMLYNGCRSSSTSKRTPEINKWLTK